MNNLPSKHILTNTTSAGVPNIAPIEPATAPVYNIILNACNILYNDKSNKPNKHFMNTLGGVPSALGIIQIIYNMTVYSGVYLVK